MDKWEKVFKYAVYMAYENVGYARCPDLQLGKELHGLVSFNQSSSKHFLFIHN